MMEANDTQGTLTRIREKLALLSKRDRHHRVFGSQKHRYRLNPCLSPQQADVLEHRYQVHLPPEYRLFLQEIGNGGVGPDYGIFPLEQSLEFRWDDWKRLFPQMSDYLREPFIPPTSREDEGQFEDGWGPGLLVLGHIGCGDFHYLVVSGVEYGHIWEGPNTFPLPVHRFASLPQEFQKPMRDNAFYAAFHHYLLSPANKERLTFLTWYECWLDTMTATL
jgi:hypothetical protein